MNVRISKRNQRLVRLAKKSNPEMSIQALINLALNAGLSGRVFNPIPNAEWTKLAAEERKP